MSPHAKIGLNFSKGTRCLSDDWSLALFFRPIHYYDYIVDISKKQKIAEQPKREREQKLSSSMYVAQKEGKTILDVINTGAI